MAQLVVGAPPCSEMTLEINLLGEAEARSTKASDPSRDGGVVEADDANPATSIEPAGSTLSSPVVDGVEVDVAAWLFEITRPQQVPDDVTDQGVEGVSGTRYAPPGSGDPAAVELAGSACGFGDLVWSCRYRWPT